MELYDAGHIRNFYDRYAELETHRWDKNPVEKVMKTGHLHPATFTDSDHHCHMFRAEEFKENLHHAGFKILTLSASNCLSAM